MRKPHWFKDIYSYKIYLWKTLIGSKIFVVIKDIYEKTSLVQRYL
jgi:hypothetical protein